jgi:nitroimidazol reductase NimA-like FMN-containing flavoprotein (pyridoxamine 5'-phosphate oxidase superfamily)
MAEPRDDEQHVAAASPAVARTARTRIRRHPERAAPERAEEILRAGRVAHVAFAVDGQPYVLPFTYHYEAGRLYLHGAPASRALTTLYAGAPVCVEVTLLDGLVASRMAKYHSMNYRSVVVFGHAVEITDEVEQRTVFERMTARYFPGRTAGQDYAPARQGDLRGTRLLAVTVEELSAKSRSGPPLGPTDGDHDGSGSRFVVVLPGVDG